MTVTGKTVIENLKDVELVEDDVIFPLSHPKKTEGGIAILRGSLAPGGRFSGSTRGPAIGHISPEAAAGGPIAVVEDGDMITIDIPNRRLELEVPEEIIKERLSRWEPLVKERTPSLAKYAALVTSADRGAILEIPEGLK